VKPIATALSCVAILALTAPAPRAADDDPGNRVVSVEHWLKAVVAHTPGEPDASVIDVANWSDTTLDLFRVDMYVLTRLMRDPRVTSFQLPNKELDCSDCFAARRDVTQARLLVQGRTIRYTDWQLHRLKVLACAAAGMLDDLECRKANAWREIDKALETLAAKASTARRGGDGNFLLRRAALLHTDVAMVTAGTLRPVNTGFVGEGRPIRLQMVDGQPTNVGLGEVHWAVGRDLLDNVRPEGDPMVRLWYRATSTWMQRDQQYNPSHTEHGRAMFPDDAVLWFLSGTQAETYASPAIQAVVKTAVLPTGTVLQIGSEGSELKSAESQLQRAVKLDPRFVEAHLHLGHVLLLRGNAQGAVTELDAIATTPDPLLQYFRLMFLGAAQEALARVDDARAAYEKAAAIFPRAQSPSLALSALDARRGDRAGSTKAIDRVFALPADLERRDDPLWRYRVVQGRNADDLLEELRRPFREGRQ